MTVGNAFTQAATANGFLTSSSQAATTSLEGSNNFAQSNAGTATDFWLYGAGVGSLTVTIPYTLSAACNIAGGPDPNQMTTADASVSLFTNFSPYTTSSVSCEGGPAIKQGDLTATYDFVSPPTWGPLLSIEASLETSANATVPEPGTVLLLISGLLGLIVIESRRFRV